MLKVIVTSHGPLAEALLSSARMVYGELPGTSHVGLSEGAGIEAFKRDFADELRRVSAGADGVLILCDMLCGTPYNVACRHAFDPNAPVPMAVVTGVNFPMLLMSAELLEGKDVQLAAQELVAQGGEAIALARPAVTAQMDDF
ncbi:MULTISPECIES: PTS sugar transporter subunit IIA [Serratia]|jgi:mannose PTS system EIIA component|uniref:PTS fructose transporter subunit IIA n=1 Tax=Serratia liquefaciens TaxID=614 RepID=A0A515D495_SERLI|nr:PTS fructose transporter subunit IIA [Serratia liquefaciens]AGQ32931.1 PTS fructose transporter subunit IIA [Serratia liquefaciens ATCC 27592]MBF8106863.1 PTS fructose transporter subunit IIA [Serratia liquefaciens]MBH2811829.1 PTS fructose transporter subunit IIA [Serratia liquefaciens]MCH4197252.1 PTS fructose transporter subunit IIA [Serratia liquefaciens]MCH4230763.1 PTS fructose transporter subunit IIA [Serratia liquefaciens]